MTIYLLGYCRSSSNILISIIDSFNVTNSIVKSKMMESDKKRSLSASIMVASKSHDIFTTHNGYW